MRYVSAATLISVLFLASISVFQDAMDQYTKERSYQNYGEWVLSAVDDSSISENGFQEVEHPYLSASGVCRTGLDLLDEAGSDSENYLGTADESFLRIGNISLYEGRMPADDNEIVMDLPALAALGYSYDLGQSVTVKTQMQDPEDEEGGMLTFQKKFTLVGTIKSFALNWAHMDTYPLPNCLVTEQALQEMGGSVYDTHFYQLDRRFEDIDVDEFSYAMTEQYELCIYNSYAYGNRIWGSAEMFTAVKIILLTITGLAVAYLMISYESGRRKWYYRYRGIGAEKSQIREMIFIEGVCGVFPFAVVGLILPQIGGALICLAVSGIKDIPYFYVFDLEQTLVQASVVLGILLLAILSAWLGSGDKRLARNTMEVTERQRKRLRKARKGNTIKSFYRRQHRLYPVRQATAVLFSAAVCTVLVLTVGEIHTQIQSWQWLRDVSRDFEADKKETYSYEWGEQGEDGSGSVSGDYYMMYSGLDARQQAEIESLIGIETLDLQLRDQRHLLEWEGREESPIIQDYQREPDGAWQLSPLESFFFYEDYDDFSRKLEYEVKDESFDREAFDRGEQIILTTGTYSTNFDSSGRYLEDSQRENLTETGISPGEKVTVTGMEHDGRTDVTVGAIVKNPEYLDTKMANVFGMIPYGIIGSVRLAEKIAEADGETLSLGNHIEIDLNSSASYESTEKQLSSLFAQSGITYSSSTETLVQGRNQLVRSLSIYGVFTLVILSVYMVLMLNFRKNQAFYMQREYTLFRRLGLEKEQFRHMTLADSGKQAVWILPGIFFAYGLKFVLCYLEWVEAKVRTLADGGSPEVYSEILGRLTDDPLWWAADSVLSDLSPIWTAVSAAAVIMLFLFCALRAQGMLEREADPRKPEIRQKKRRGQKP